MAKVLKRLRVENENADRIQDNTNLALQNLYKEPFLSGVFVEDLTVSAGPFILEHKLGRIPKGYLLTKSNVFTLIKVSGQQTEFYSQMEAQVAGKISVYIF